MLSPTYIVSSNIDCVAHRRNQLFIRFKSGETYSYDGVPYDHFDALQKVESPGQFFHRHIRSKFPYTRMEADPFTSVGVR